VATRSADGDHPVHALPGGGIGTGFREMCPLATDPDLGGLRPVEAYTDTTADTVDMEVVVGVAPVSDTTTQWAAIRVDHLINGKPGSQLYRTGAPSASSHRVSLGRMTRTDPLAGAGARSLRHHAHNRPLAATSNPGKRGGAHAGAAGRTSEHRRRADIP